MIKFFKVCIFSFAMSSVLGCPVAHADDAVTLNKGEEAPFTGTLLSPTAISKILAKEQISKEECKIETDNALGSQKAKSDLEISILDSKNQSCQTLTQKTQEINDKYILELEKELSRNKLKSDLSFIGGVISGIGITVVSAWALSKAAE